MGFMTKVEEALNDSSITTHYDKGTKFEYIVKSILKQYGLFRNQYKEVYLWDEFNKKFNVNRKDFGIDLMAKTHDETWVSVQCKAYSYKEKMHPNDLKSFLAWDKVEDNNGNFITEISSKLIFHTAKEVSSNV